MNIKISIRDHFRCMGESATSPIEPRCGTLAVLHPQGVRRIRKPLKAATIPLFLVAGRSQPPRLASVPHHSPLGLVQLRFLG